MMVSPTFSVSCKFIYLLFPLKCFIALFIYFIFIAFTFSLLKVFLQTYSPLKILYFLYTAVLVEYFTLIEVLRSRIPILFD
jgi:hypothetical protein